MSAPGESDLEPTERNGSRRRRLVLHLVLVGALVFGAMQLVPYGWRRSNPPVMHDARWPSEEAAALARAACYDCHSNETEWPLYASVAPASWLLRRDVDSGRDEVNFSDWLRDAGEADDAADAIREGSMPPDRYLLLHPDARLSAQEKQVLIRALRQMDD